MAGSTSQTDTGVIASEAEDGPARLGQFESWCKERGITHHASIKIMPMEDDGGYRVVATEPIQRGSVLPKSQIFSHRTATLTTSPTSTVELPEPTSSEEFLYRLAACLLFELRLGPHSRWYPWLQVLPREIVPIPLLWTDNAKAADTVGTGFETHQPDTQETLSHDEDGLEALQWLEGTDAGRELQRQQEQDGLSLAGLNAYFTSNLPLFPPTSTFPASPSPTDWAHAFSLISSRAFMLDTYHQIGIVPLCDMYNHDSEAAHTSLLCDPGAMVTVDADTNERQERKEGAGSEDPLGGDVAEDVAIEVPPEASTTTDRTDSHAPHQVDMVAERDIAPGEVFSNYDDNMTSAKALVGYGFVPSEPSQSRVSWGPREILDPRTGAVYMEICQNGRVASEIYNADGAEKQDGTVPLFSRSPSDSPGSFNLNGDTSLSINIFLALYIAAAMDLELDFYSVEQLEEEVIRDARCLLVGGAAIEPGVLEAVVQRIIGLLAGRLEGMCREELSPDVLAEMRDSLPHGDVLQRRAIAFAIDERRLLLHTKQRWQRLLSGDT